MVLQEIKRDPLAGSLFVWVSPHQTFTASPVNFNFVAGEGFEPTTSGL